MQICRCGNVRLNSTLVDIVLQIKAVARAGTGRYLRQCVFEAVVFPMSSFGAEKMPSHSS